MTCSKLLYPAVWDVGFTIATTDEFESKKTGIAVPKGIQAKARLSFDKGSVLAYVFGWMSGKQDDAIDTAALWNDIGTCRRRRRRYVKR